VSSYLPFRLRSRYRPARFLVAVVALASVAACSSVGSDDSKSDGNQGTNSNAPAGEGVAEAQAALTEAEKVPTDIPVTTPLKGRPDSGKTIAYMACDVPNCDLVSDGMEEATAALGWNYQKMPFQGANPATLVAQMERALQDGVDAVVVSGLPVQVWQGEIPKFEAAGIPIIASAAGPGIVPSGPVIASLPSDAALTDQGVGLANWMIVDSNGHGHALIVTVNDYPGFKNVAAATEDYIKTSCPGCDASTLSLTIPQYGGGEAPSVITAQLTRDPSIDYVIVVATGSSIGLPAAMSAAGVEAKVVEFNGNRQTLTDLSSGDLSAGTFWSVGYFAWAHIDALARHFEGSDPVSEDGDLPWVVLTNESDFEVSDDYSEPAGYQDQFKALWQVD
jgi:ABC-type sugar transport system substrate-binding protein